MAGKGEIVDLIKSKAHQFGLEAQSATIVGIIKAIESFSGERMLDAFRKKHLVYEAVKKGINSIRETPTGVMLSADDLINELKQKGVETEFSPADVACVFSALLLRNYHIVTIPAVGMPGASPTIRIDLAAKDAERIDKDYIVKAFIETFSHLNEIVNYKDACELILYEYDA
jgi:L-seryl-tRNA(Ser) seleniumtransferase